MCVLRNRKLMKRSYTWAVHINLNEEYPPDQVNHMQYAIEWFAFALIPLIGWPIVLVRIARRQQPEREPASA